MPYMREGATKISDHWVRSPLLNVNRACQTCHRATEEEIKARVDTMQQRSFDLMERGGAAMDSLLGAFAKAKQADVPVERLDPARRFQRKAQWRLDFVAAENSMGFHAPQETARLLAEAIDYARQGELALLGALPPVPAESTPAPLASSAPIASAPRVQPPPAPSAGKAP
jgi:nitrite reductase (cytochrome c-552)